MRAGMRANAVALLVLVGFLGGESRARAATEPVATMLEQYASIHDALAADRAEGVSSAATRIAEIASSASSGGKTGDAFGRVAAAAGAMRGSEIGALRDGMKELSKALFAVAGSAADLYYCPMIDGYWLQKKGDSPRNPYYGKSMSRCGEKVDKVED